MYVRVKIPRRRWAIHGGQVLLVALGLVAATTAFRCPGPEPAATGGPGGSGGSGGSSGTMADASSSTGMCTAEIMNDPMNCGACGHACSTDHADVAMPPFCMAGQCMPLCMPPYVDVKHPQAPEPDDGCESQAKFVFVSEAVVIPSMMGGLQGSDGLCQTWASMSGAPPGTYKAWLSDSVSSAESRLTHNDGPYLRPDGMIVADNWGDLTDGSLDNPINVTELLMTLPLTPPAPVWTGTDPMGKSVGPNCADWTGGSTSQGIIGTAGAVGADWTILPNANSCFNENVHLYCIQQ